MTYRVPSGLAAMLGAGILAGLAPAARDAGVWLLAGLVLAALLAVACGLSSWDRVGALAVLGRIAGAAAIAATFGAYLVPEHPIPAAIGLIALAAALAATGFRPPRVVVGLAVAVVLGALVVFVAACLAIEPAGRAVSPPAGGPGADDLTGLPVATALMFFCFLGFERAGARRRDRLVTIGVALACYLAVAGAALRQLGGPRLALSPTPLREALAAADASGLEPALAAGVAVASLSAMLGVFAELRRGGRPVLVPLAGAGAATAALLLTVPVTMGLAAGLMLAHYALGAIARLLNRDQHQHEDDHGEHDGDRERAAVDVPREERTAVSTEPPHRPRDGAAEAEHDAEAADPEVTEQDQRSRQERRHGGHRGDLEV